MGTSLLSSLYKHRNTTGLLSQSQTLHSTYDCATTQNNTIIKYADDTTVLGLLKGGNETDYRELFDKILAYGKDNDRILNIDKKRINHGF